jgi:hypothetical protein
MPDLSQINDLLTVRFPNSTTASPLATQIASSDLSKVPFADKAIVSSSKKKGNKTKTKGKPTPNVHPELIETLTPTQDFDVAKDSYRNAELSTNKYVRAAIETQEEQIVEIKLKRVPKVQDFTKSVQDNLFKPGSVGGYAHFFIQSIQTPKQERVQILETFTTSWIYLFVQMTPIYTFSGILLNYGDDSSPDDSHSWATDFMKVSDEQIRGTKSVESGGILEIAFDNILVQGYMLNSNLMRNAATPYGVPFSFSLAIVKESYLGFGVFFSDQIDRKLTNPTAEDAAKPRIPESSVISDLGGKLNSMLKGITSFIS